MSSEEIFINGELLRLGRESRGWLLNDMATRTCMSVKQIRQIEEGGISSFYSVAVKATAAKKIGALLGLSEEQVFAHNLVHDPVSEVINSDALSEGVVVEQAPVEPAVLQERLDAEPQISVPNSVEAVTAVDESKSKVSIWLIAALFVAALAVAAYLQPKDELPTEPVPALQVVPSDISDPASAASVPDSPTEVSQAALAPASAVISQPKPASLAASKAP
jgi:transcriptional regulator with XRE-family HTH domain